MVAASLFGILPSAQAAELPTLQGTAACLMDADTGQVLFEQNMDSQQPPASITKIMTALLTVENCQLTDIVTMSDEAVFSVPRSASHIALQPGEQLTVEQALMATMLPSANDAANGLAEQVAGSMDAFVEMMNQRAAECGAKNTHFANANGLDQEGHLTTAYDMACITRQALKNETFRMVFGTTEYTIPLTNLQPEARNIGAGHKMVFDFTKYYDPTVIGGKSGYTDEAGNTLVTVAQRDGRTLIAVVLGEPRNAAMYEDTIALFEYGYSAFDSLTISAEQLARGNELVDPEDSLTVLVTEGISAEDLTFEYTTGETGADSCTVEVQAVLTQETGLQYAVLGSTTLQYHMEVLPTAQTAETSQAQTTALQVEEEQPLLVKALLTAGRLAVSAVTLAIIVVVFGLFVIRLWYDLKGNRKKRRVRGR